MGIEDGETREVGEVAWRGRDEQTSVVQNRRVAKYCDGHDSAYLV